MTYASGRTNTFELARVIDRTIATVRDNFLSFFIVSVCLAGAPAMVAQFVLFATPPGSAEAGVGAIVRVLVQMLGGVLGLVLQGALVWGTVTYLNGRRAPMREVLGVGLRKFLPLLGLGVCLGLAVGLGFLLLIVPGVLLILMWSVAAPALVVERTGVFGAFSRSAQLTKGNRWAVLGLGLLFWVASSIVGGVSAVFMGVILFSNLAQAGAAAPSTITLAGGLFAAFGALVSGLFSAALAMLGAVGVGVLYVELRRAREGVGPQAVADIFA